MCRARLADDWPLLGPVKKRVMPADTRFLTADTCPIRDDGDSELLELTELLLRLLLAPAPAPAPDSLASQSSCSLSRQYLAPLPGTFDATTWNYLLQKEGRDTVASAVAVVHD